MKQLFVTCTEDKVGDVLHYLESVEEIRNVAKVHVSNGFLLIFSLPQSKTRNVVSNLERLNAGYELSNISVLDIEVHKPPPPEETDEKDPFSRKARVTIEEIYAKIVSSNQLNFDFMTFLISSSLIAGAGLATNNAVAVVASMLVSPLMGPILAFSLGGLIGDKRLLLKGFMNEIVAVVIAIIIGIVIGLCGSPFSEILGWPTFEMSSRGEIAASLSGIIIAGASGAAVAVAVTSENFASLVGVAISASLLPPAVNVGMLFIFAYLGPGSRPNFPYTQDELLIMAGNSFLLLGINIMMINLVGTLFFKLKEISPHHSSTSGFWSNLPEINEDDRAELWHIAENTPQYNIPSTVTWHRNYSWAANKPGDTRRLNGDVEERRSSRDTNDSSSSSINLRQRRTSSTDMDDLSPQEQRKRQLKLKYGNNMQNWLTGLANGEINESDIPSSLMEAG